MSNQAQWPAQYLLSSVHYSPSIYLNFAPYSADVKSKYLLSAGCAAENWKLFKKKRNFFKIFSLVRSEKSKNEISSKFFLNLPNLQWFFTTQKLVFVIIVQGPRRHFEVGGTNTYAKFWNLKKKNGYFRTYLFIYCPKK